MGTSRLLVVGAMIGGLAIYWWKGQGNDLAHAEKSPNGFVSVVMPDGASPNTVVIFAPLNCPSDAAQRAEALSEELARQGIRAIRSASYSSDIDNPTEEQEDGLKRAVAVMNGQIPAVFVNGMAKANPTVAEVVSELKLTR